MEDFNKLWMLEAIAMIGKSGEWIDGCTVFFFIFDRHGWSVNPKSAACSLSTIVLEEGVLRTTM